ncbi:hypothetical protein [Desulfurococcus sp.]
MRAVEPITVVIAVFVIAIVTAITATTIQVYYRNNTEMFRSGRDVI